MNPSPSPLLQDWIQIPTVAWLVVGCIALVWLAILTVEIVHIWEEDDAANEDVQVDRLAHDVARYHCAGHGCQLRTFYSDAGGTTWVCVNCERAYWVPGASVFDQTEESV